MGNSLKAQPENATPDRSEDSLVDHGSVLAELGISHAELLSLKRQGFVGQERRRSGRLSFKLRFRFQDRQRVKYIGSDAGKAEQLRKELAGLQATHRHVRELASLIREAKQLIRVSKKNIEPELKKIGYRFHGFSIRKKPLTLEDEPDNRFLSGVNRVHDSTPDIKEDVYHGESDSSGPVRSSYVRES